MRNGCGYGGCGRGRGQGRNRSNQGPNQAVGKGFDQGQNMANRQESLDTQADDPQAGQFWPRFLRLRRRDGSCLSNSRQGR